MRKKLALVALLGAFFIYKKSDGVVVGITAFDPTSLLPGKTYGVVSSTMSFQQAAVFADKYDQLVYSGAKLQGVRTEYKQVTTYQTVQKKDTIPTK